ncbi:MAG: NAD(P)H-dependent oxidoreductase [Patescibacteria group bacterium]|jgi:NAD(P)H-dependent FMN reductase
MNKPKIIVLLASIRVERAGEKVARWFMNVVQATKTASVELVDLRDYPLPLFADAVTPTMRQGRHPNPLVQKWLDKLATADGYIIITPEYNHSIPGALKNAIDYAYKEWNNKAVGFVSYGGAAAGSRAVEHLRQIASELQLHDVRPQVLIPFVWSVFDAQGNLLNHTDAYEKSSIILIESVALLAKQLQKIT